MIVTIPIIEDRVETTTMFVIMMMMMVVMVVVVTVRARNVRVQNFAHDQVEDESDY